ITIGHCVATFPTNLKVVTTVVCCNVCCNKALRLQLLYWPVGHCRAGRHRRRRRRNPAAAVHDVLVVVAPPPASRRAATCHPSRRPDPSHTPPCPAVHHPDARSRRLSHDPRARPRGRTCTRERGARNTVLGKCRKR
ncbi:hypothetical protein EV122DRAFT_186262, partial [Schizophyllum commune]